jgi:hypothetical protein
MLSKSEYLMFLKHPAWLWYKKFDKTKLPVPGEKLQAMFDEGFEFENYAERLFSDGIKIERGDYNGYLTQPARTREALQQGVKTIFQGRFESKKITCICDIVEVTGVKTIDISEIKSSTDAKKSHLYDLAFQKKVLEECGYRVGRLRVLCVNSDYVRRGEIDPAAFVRIIDVTDDVLLLKSQTDNGIATALELIENGIKPDISPALADPDAFREWVEIYRSLVNVSENDILNLGRLTRDQYTELQKLHLSQITEIPADFPLVSQQKLQIQAVKEDKVIADKSQIRKFLSELVFPLYFLDYETFGGVVPQFDGLKPYQQVPFQYSLHALETPEGELKHFSYLHTENTYPVLPLTESLQSQIREKGTVLVWHEGFEKSRNSEMGCINNACAVFYKKLNNRIIDLKKPFSSGWYVDKRFFGSASIKKVLPVLVPTLSYQKLEIQEGGTAQRLWTETVFGGQKNLIEREKTFRDLEDYCRLDTLAMVEIYRVLGRIAKET